MPSYRSPADRSMDILYLLLPIIGAFILLFLVCCFGRKVKDMLHFPKELVLGRHFPGLASSTTSSRSSLSDYGHYDRGRTHDTDDEGPTIIVNVSSEHQRVLNQRHHHHHHHRTRHHHYSHVPSTEIFSFQQNSSSTDVMPLRGAPSMQLRRLPSLKKHKSVQYKRSDSCPLMSALRSDELDRQSMLGHAPQPFKLHLGYLDCHGNSEIDSDSDIPETFSRPTGRHRHRSNSDSDILRCLNSESEDYFSNNRFSQFSHKLASTEIQLHAPVDSTVTIGNSNEAVVTYQAEVG